MKLLIRDSTGESKPINIMPSEMVKDLKDQIKKKNKITGEIELVFNGIMLEDSQQLSDKDLGIQDGNTIDYLGQFNAGLYEVK